MKKFLILVMHHWYLYVIALLMGVFVINYSIDLINKPRNEETITLFIACSESGSSIELRKKLNEEKPSYLREINIFTVDQNSKDYDRYFTIYGMDNSDIVILPKNKIEDDVVTHYYASFEKEYIEEYVSPSSYYVSENNGLMYGIKVHSIGEENALINYRNDGFDEDYYAFFIKKSKHIGKLYQSEYVTAFNFINIIKNN